MSFKKNFLTDSEGIYFIAEIGINHNGVFDLAVQMIDESKKAGAKAVKFQKRNPKYLLLEGTVRWIRAILDTRDDIISENLLVLPSDQEIVAELQSRDVIHSFSINKLRLKQDIVPGLAPRIWFKITQNGVWEINCMELCGWGHFRMSARLKTVPTNEFDAWLLDTVRQRGY